MKCRLKIVPFQNPGGTPAVRVTGTLPSGERVQRNFSGPNARLRAQALINELTLSAVESAGHPRPVITHLTETTVRMVEAALRKLPAGTDITQAVDFFAAHWRPVQPVKIADAIAEFGAWLREQRKCEEETIMTRETVLTAFARSADVEWSDGITAEKAHRWIYSPEVAVRTQRDRFDLLNWFGQFLVAKRRALFHPTKSFAQDRPVVKVKAPGVLTFDETWRLLQCALTDAEGPQMLPFFAVCVLSGVRPDEAPRLGAIGPDGQRSGGWDDIYLEAEHRVIEVNKAKGGRSRRNVSISDPLWRILTWCKERKLAANYFSKRKFDRIRRRAGLKARWEKDLLRHTYASHAYIVQKDVKQLEKDMGNSERVLFQNYIRPVPLADGIRMQGIALHYTAPREHSAMGTGPKPRRRLTAPPPGATPL